MTPDSTVKKMTAPEAITLVRLALSSRKEWKSRNSMTGKPWLRHVFLAGATILSSLFVDAPWTLVLASGSQTIAFDAIPNQILGISPFPIAAQASSGLLISIVSATPAVCKSAGDLVMLLSAGTCSITASQPGNTSYNAATPVTRSFTVSLAKPSSSFTAAAGSPFAATNPVFVAVGDFNGDGIQDLAAADGSSSNVTVLLGNGSGGFTAAPGSPITVGTDPSSVVVGDFNGDGIEDLATANSESNNVTVLLGNGTGGFTEAPGSPFMVGTGPVSIVVGDFNGDGIQDLATANYDSADVTVLLGNGSGGFTTSTLSALAGGGLAESIVVGDFNGDGIQDLAVAHGNSVTVLLGNGLGGFTAATGSPFSVGGTGLTSLTVGDFNGDGIQDLATANFDSSNVAVLLGNGSGGFTAAAGSPFAVGNGPLFVAVGDFNGDGIQDIATPNQNDNNITVLLGNGSGGFTAAAGGPFAVGSFPRTAAVGDFNGDGIQDLAVANLGNNVTVLLGVVGHTSQTITFGALGNVTYGVSPLMIGATASSGLAVSFASTTSGVCTVSGGTVTIVGGGICSIVASQTGNATYAPAATVTQSFTVTPASQTITFAPLSNVSLGVSPFNVGATASSGLAVSFASTTSGVCTVAGSTVTVVGPGMCSITASQAGNTSYAAAAPVTQSFVVTTPLTWTLNAAFGDGGMAVGVFTFEAGTRTFSNWNVSTTGGNTSVFFPFGFTPANSFLGFNNPLNDPSQREITFVSNAAFPDPSAPSPESLVLAFTPDSPLTDAGGSINISPGATLVFSGECFDCVPARLITSGTVYTTQGNQASQTITFDAVPKQILGVSPFPIAAQASSGLAVSFASTTTAVCKNAGDLVMLLSAGTCSVTASQGGNASYGAATSVTRSFTVSLAKPSGSFTAAAGSPFTTGANPNPNSVVVGDFNGDGIPDLATANLGGSQDTVTVLLGNGSGGFTAAPGSPFTVGINPTSVVVGDFNGDGIQDLAVANSSSNSISVLLGNGSGGFTAAPGSPFAAGTNPLSVVVGDFNGDGIQDLAAANLNGGNVTVLLGNGSGGFTAAPGSPFAAPGQPTSVAVGDFNGDGIQDLAVASQFSDNVTVLLGNGSGGFTPALGSPFAVGTNPASAVVGDFNGDGVQDLAIANFGGGSVTVLLGNGTGGFTPAPGSPFAIGANPNSVVVGDFNGDGIQDLATANEVGGNNITVLLGNGSGGFTVATGSPFAVGAFPASVAVGDFNGDGIQDLATANNGSSNITVLLGAVAGHISQTITFGTLNSVTYGVSPFTIGATANSGLAVSFASTAPFVCTITGNTVTIVGAGICPIVASQAGNATYAAAATVTQSFAVIPASQTITFAPLSNVSLGAQPFTISATASSGLAVSFASNTTGVCTVATNTVTIVGTSTCSITASQPGNANYAAAAPVTQTFTVSGLSSQTITFDATPNQIFGVSPFPIAAEASSGLAVSFASTTTAVCKNAGGLVMLLSAGTCSIAASQGGNASYGAATSVTRSFTVSLAKPSGSFTAAASSPFAVGTNPESVAVGDFNGDGIPDLATANWGSGNVTVLLGNGLGGFTAAPGSPFPVGTNPRSVTVGDFNGDGIQDLAIANNSSGNVTVLLGNGSGGFTAASGSPFAAGAGPRSAAVGDFNGDGIQDLAVANENGNNVTVLLGNGSGGFTAAAGSPFAVGTGPESVAVGDFNGDGIQDLVTANFGSNNVTVLLGNGSGGFTAATGSPFAAGLEPYFAAVGDFNGDGVQDLAITNFSSTNITVLLGNGSGGFTEATGSPFPVGTAPIYAAVGDFNGDGIQDLATANYGSNNVTVLLGNGSGGFTAATGSPFAAGLLPYSIAVADFNGDGIEDLAAANLNSNNVTVLLGFVAGHTSQTITFGTLSNMTYGVSPFMIGATASSGLAVSFASTTSYVCTVSGSTVTIVAAGACSIVASQAGNATYAAAATVMQSFTVIPASQTITFAPPGSVSGTALLGATASSGLAVSFASTTSAFCTVSGITVTAVAAGTCSIAASQAGNANYAAAMPVTQSFAVTSGPQTLTTYTYHGNHFTSVQTPYTTSNFITGYFTSPTLTANLSGVDITSGISTYSFTDGSVNTITSSEIAPNRVIVGTDSQGNITSWDLTLILGSPPTDIALFTCNGISTYFNSCPTNPYDWSYEGNGAIDGENASNPGTWSASRASQTITFDAIPKQILGVSPFPIAAQASSGLPMGIVSTTPVVCKTAGGLVTLLGAGTCSITASQGGNGSYGAATSVTRSFTVSLAKPSGSFISAAGSPFPAGAESYSAAVGDFNGDGIPDLATANYDSNNVTVLLGNGSGGFTAATGSPFAVGSVGPLSVAVGDFNGDGIQDLAVANQGGTVTVLLGNGSGGFTVATGSPFAAGIGPSSVVVGDFNGDGIQDLAVANSYAGAGLGNTVTVLLGNGSGGFTAAPGSPFAVGNDPESIVAGDFNGDGIQDLATANFNDSNVTVLLGNGSGGFTAAPGSPFTVASTPAFVVVGDFNGDGIPDLATANYNSANVTVLLGNGSGGFTAAAGSPFAVGALPASVVVGDFNGDGIQDIATANQGNNNLTVLLGNGSGGFTAAAGSPFAVGTGPVSVVVGDFNGDGIEDLATANFNSNNVTVMLGFLVGHTSQTITFGPLSNVTYGVSPFAIGANASSGLAVSLASTTSAVCTVSGGTVTIVGGGVCSIVASQAGNATYAAAATVMQSFTVTPASQTITFAPLSNVSLGVSPFNVSATASSGLAVSFASNTTGVCTVATNTVTIVATSTCSITASQAGNANYAAATPVTQSFTVNSASQTTPQAVSVSPSTGSGASQTFALEYADPLGVTDLTTVWVWFTSNFNSVSSANSCIAYYARAANQIFLLNDAGTAFASAAPGSAVTLSNSQCSMNAAAASVTSSGMDLTLNLPVAFTVAYAGTKSTYMYAAGSSANSGWQMMGTWTVPATVAAVTTVSITPNSGSGVQQTFALQYADSLGVTDLATVWFWITSNFSGSSANSCLLYYARAANQIFLLNDAGTVWSPPVAPGAAVTLANSQCSMNAAQASVTTSGTNLTLNLPMTFTAAYAGMKSTYMYALGSSANSAWQAKGTWTVPATVAAVSTVSVTPNSGTGMQQAFALQYADSLGATDLATVWFWITSNFNAGSSANSCLLYYARAANQIFLLNDAGTVWSPPVAPGAAVTLSNSQCSMNAAQASVTASGTNLTLNLPMTFTALYGGTKSTYMYAAGSSANSGWQALGTWTVPVTVAVVTTVSVTPTRGAQPRFELAYADSLGATDLSAVWVWFTSNFNTVSSANSCIAYYARATNLILLINDAGTAYSSAAPGAAVTLSNSNCSINASAASVTLSGVDLTLNLPVTFAAGYAGAKSIWMFAAGPNANSGWQNMGSWTVPLGSAPVPVSVTPGSGSGLSQTFALQYADSLGSADLSTVWVWFTSTFNTVTSANSCIAYYVRTTNQINLINDAGTAILSSAAPGAAVTLSNSQCSINMAAATVTPSGTDLTVNLPVTFTGAFAGAKGIFMFASGLSANSGWQSMGTWTVP
jgi:hypothetical protein